MKSKLILYIVIGIVGVTLAIATGAFIYSSVAGFKNDLFDKFDGIGTALEYNFDKLDENIAQSDTQEIDLSKLIAILGKISLSNEVILARFNELDVVPTVVTHTTGHVSGDTAIIYVETLADIPKSFTFRTQDGMPLAYYEIVQTEEGSYELNTGTHTLAVRVTNVTGYNSADTPLVVTEATIQSSGEDVSYPITIDSSVTYHAPENPVAWQWWDPQIEVGIFAGYDFYESVISVGGDLGLTAMSYGTGIEDIIRVPRIGIGTNGASVGITASPVGFNIGAPLPIVEDLWLYPGVYMEVGKWEPAVILTVSSTL